MTNLLLSFSVILINDENTLILVFIQFLLTHFPCAILSYIKQESPKKDSIISRMFQSFPYIFNILRPHSHPETIQEKEKYKNQNVNSINGSHNWSSELQSILTDATTDAKTFSRFVFFLHSN